MESKTDKILEYFDKINAVPRCSKNEARICQWLKEWAAAKRLDVVEDLAGNLVIRVPASPGYENRPVVILQGHMDMVCEKTPDSSHDFTKDSIRSINDGAWLTADRTTLGADNGIAIAYALVLAEDRSIRHPPLELLFTVDEETGLNGVKAMTPGLVNGRILINLDSEDEGIFTIGCAGGVDTRIDLTLKTAALEGLMLHQVVVGGLRGGHSGIDIDKHRGNANKILARTLAQIHQVSPSRLVSLKGGTRHNAIARDAEAVVAWQPVEGIEIEIIVGQMEQTIQKEYGSGEPGLFIKVGLSSPSARAGLTLDDTERVIWLLLALPHGVAGMSPTLKELVETSSNLAVVGLKDGHFSILSSQRSALGSRLTEMTATIHAVADLAAAAARDENQYPPWQPDMSTPLLKQAQETYHRLFAQEPTIQVIHAGLECAIIGDTHPGMQMISFGPTIENPHSPNERLYIPSVEKVWRFLVGLLEILGEQGNR